MKLTLLRAAFALCFFSFFPLFTALVQAQNTPLAAFIAREKLQHSFRPVNGLLKEAPQPPLASVDAYVSKAQFFDLDPVQLGDFMAQSNKGIRLTLPDGEGSYFELDLARFGILAQGFRVQEINDKGSSDVHYTPGLYYRGVVNNIPGSLAAFSFFNEELYGVFSIPGKGNFSISPNTMIAGSSKDHYILYNDADLKVVRHNEPCRSDDMKVLGLETENTASRLAYNNCKDVEVMLQADYATYLSRSSSTTDVANYLTSIFNVLCVLYRNEAIYTSIKAINVNTTSDAYQSLTNSSSAFLAKFGELTQNNMNGADLAHLVSTRYNGNMGGIAWLNVLCLGYQGASQFAGPYAFSNIYASETAGTFPTYTWNVECMTHEMGHNLGSAHTHNCTAWVGGPIDGCAPTANPAYAEGTCATGPVPTAAVKGTIMSYCHLLSGIGINFSNGFGPQPGDLIRSKVSSAACAANYIPDTVLSVSNTVLNATRECTDASGLTFYWNDNENSDESDNRLVLKLRKGTNSIGTLDDAGFAVSTVVLPAYGSNAGTAVTFPSGVPNTGSPAAAMNRYWNVTPVSQPTTTVEVQFPFTQQDINDVGGSIPSVTSYTNMRFYKMGTGVNPDPSAGFTGSTAANTVTYAYSPTLTSTSTWTYATSGNTRFARFLVNSFSGGGGFGSTTVPLPMTLIWFKGTARDRVISLDWEVANEKGLKEYIVERAADAVHYESISIVAAQNLSAKQYNTIDKNPLQGNNYYRLSLVNSDGTKQIIAFTHVLVHGGTALSIYPNPAKEELHIAVTGQSLGQAKVQLLDRNGRMVLSAVLDKADNKFNLQGYAKGLYLLRVISGQEMVQEKLLIR